MTDHPNHVPADALTPLEQQMVAARAARAHRVLDAVWKERRLVTYAATVDAVLDIVGRVRAERIGDGTLDFDFGVGVDPFTKAADDLRRASGIRTEGTATDA